MHKLIEKFEKGNFNYGICIASGFNTALYVFFDDEDFLALDEGMGKDESLIDEALERFKYFCKDFQIDINYAHSMGGLIAAYIVVLSRHGVEWSVLKENAMWAKNCHWVCNAIEHIHMLREIQKKAKNFLEAYEGFSKDEIIRRFLNILLYISVGKRNSLEADRVLHNDTFGLLHSEHGTPIYVYPEVIGMTDEEFWSFWKEE